MKTMFAVLVVFSALAGCASTGSQVKADQLTAFETGKTTEVDVIKVLGKPQTLMSSSDGSRVMTYAFAQYQVKGATFIPVVGLFAGGADIRTSSTVFTFDKAGKLVNHQTTETQQETRNGRSSTPSP